MMEVSENENEMADVDERQRKRNGGCLRKAMEEKCWLFTQNKISNVDRLGSETGPCVSTRS